MQDTVKSIIMHYLLNTQSAKTGLEAQVLFNGSDIVVASQQLYLNVAKILTYYTNSLFYNIIIYLCVSSFMLNSSCM